MDRSMRRALKRAAEKKKPEPMRLMSDPRGTKGMHRMVPLRITTQLSGRLAAWREAKRNDLVDVALDGISKWLQILSRMPPGPKRAVTVHQHLDKMIAENRAQFPEREEKLSCKKGCSHCCNIQVMLSEDEADLLHKVVQHEKIEVDVERLRAQATWREDDYPKNFFSGKAACVFLDRGTGECKVYEHRPMSCRSYFVASPSEMCKPREDGSDPEQVYSYFLGDAAVFETAAVSLGIEKDPEKHRTLPALLLERIERGNESRDRGREGDARRARAERPELGVSL